MTRDTTLTLAAILGGSVLCGLGAVYEMPEPALLALAWSPIGLLSLWGIVR